MHPFRAAVEARDFDAALALFAEDAMLDSPVSFKPFEGIDALGAVLRAAADTFEDFHYTAELPGDGVHALFFSARVGDRSVEGLDLLRSDDAGRITNITIMVRPLSGLIALAEAMAPKVGHLAK